MAQRHSTIRNGQRLVWSCPTLWEAARGLPILDIPIDDIAELDQNCWFDEPPTLREVADHLRRIQQADLSYPIILNDDGTLMDGGHRVCKALLQGATSICAVRFDTMPEPDDVLPADSTPKAPAVISDGTPSQPAPREDDP